MKPTKPLLLASALAAVLALGWHAMPLVTPAAAAPASVAPLASVEVASAVSQTIAPTRWVPGTVISRSDARIGTELGGRLLATVEVGSEVRAGDVLVRLDSEALRIEQRQLRADVERLRTRHSHAGQHYQRLQSMDSRSAVAAMQLDEARMQRDVLEQELARAQALLADNQRRIKASTITAPFAGTVVERLVQHGEVVAAGSPLLRLVDTRSLEVQARAPAQAALELEAGTAVQLRAGTAMLASQLRTVVPVGDSGSRQLELRVALQEVNWPVGSAVEVAIPERQAHQGIAVPRDALVQRGEQTFVFRIAQGKAERLEVRTGAGLGDQVEVSGAIDDGDQLVIRGAERLRDGQEVAVTQRG